MFNHIQEKRFDHIDHKLIPLTATDLHELFFKEYTNRRGNFVFYRYDRMRHHCIKLEEISQGKFQYVSSEEGVEPFVIKRWIEVVTLWKKVTGYSIFTM